MSEKRAEALERLDVFVGEWALEVPDQPAPPDAGEDVPVARSWFEWTLDGQFLVQRSEVKVPGAPDGLMIVSADPETGAYTQHYYDSRGVVRLYAMSFDGRVWTLTREAPDFTPLDFGQRFTGTLSEDGNTVTGAWESRRPGGDWQHDFALDYRRLG
ncbi:DUF1579 family protein [Streptomyces brasiliensis]|uniref:DUF1579 family protein n=1 Tax=Streptomyces brasiliensis TaxID=1954 RepID=UPI001E3DC82D|nr:DUF1579 family protein [Streptomyces brasiliensis]